MSDRTLNALVRKLHAWELGHLREHIEEQSALIEQQLGQIEQLTRERDHAEDCADMWQRDALRAIVDCGAQPGLKIDGTLVALTHDLPGARAGQFAELAGFALLAHELGGLTQAQSTGVCHA